MNLPWDPCDDVIGLIGPWVQTGVRPGSDQVGMGAGEYPRVSSDILRLSRQIILSDLSFPMVRQTAGVEVIQRPETAAAALRGTRRTLLAALTRPNSASVPHAPLAYRASGSTIT